jgi:hypothetical protein
MIFGEGELKASADRIRITGARKTALTFQVDIARVDGPT